MFQRLRENWPEYLIEAWALGTFMLSAGVFTVLIEQPDFGLRESIASEALRRVLIGLAMGATAVALIYSPWGRRSGAHMNPAVTLTFLQLGRVHRVDAAFYVGAQFIGGLLGVQLVLALFGERFAAPPIEFVATRPAHGVLLAFALELLISFGLMFAVLKMTSHTRLARFTGLAAGTLVATYIALEAPYSGMSMNPARSFASALPAGLFADLWIYFIAPPLGMAAAAALQRRLGRRGCAKLFHAPDVRCIHCGYRPSAATQYLAKRGIDDASRERVSRS